MPPAGSSARTGALAVPIYVLCGCFLPFNFFFFFWVSDLDRFGVRFFFLFQRRGEIRKKIGPSDNDLRSDEKKWHMVVRAGHEGVNTTWKRTTADAPK